MRLSHKPLRLISACISLTIEMLVHCTIQGILSILHQTHISETSIFFLYHLPSTSMFKTEKTSDCIGLFLVFLKILLLHVTLLRSLVTVADKPPSALMMEPKYTNAFIF